MRAALTFLSVLTRLAPPDKGKRHGLALEDDGELVATVFQGDGWRSFIFESSDLDRNPEEMANEIARLLRESSPEKTDG